MLHAKSELQQMYNEAVIYRWKKGNLQNFNLRNFIIPYAPVLIFLSEQLQKISERRDNSIFIEWFITTPSIWIYAFLYMYKTKYQDHLNLVEGHTDI